jgi:hypothetical protein
MGILTLFFLAIALMSPLYLYGHHSPGFAWVESKIIPVLACFVAGVLILLILPTVFPPDKRNP